LKENMEKK